MGGFKMPVKIFENQLHPKNFAASRAQAIPAPINICKKKRLPRPRGNR